jgi:hypothetical protein
MFGKKPPQNLPPQPPRLKAADVAKIQGGGLVQLIITDVQPLAFHLFLNEVYVPQEMVESFSLSIEAPASTALGGVVRATLARFVDAVTGQRQLQRTELFPCTIEVIALGRRLSVTALQADSLDGLWLSLGLRPDGTSAELQGLASLRILIMEGFVNAKLTWNDGDVEEIFPSEDVLGL